MLINFVGIHPIQALFRSAVISGPLALPWLILLMLIANNRRIMGKHVHGWKLHLFGWLGSNNTIHQFPDQRGRSLLAGLFCLDAGHTSIYTENTAIKTGWEQDDNNALLRCLWSGSDCAGESLPCVRLCADAERAG
jgi:hypothetical protein